MSLAVMLHDGFLFARLYFTPTHRKHIVLPGMIIRGVLRHASTSAARWTDVWLA